jgi:hypothetical protein
MRRRSSVELMGRKRQVRLSRAEENKGRHCLGRAMRVPAGEARLCARGRAGRGDAMRCGAGSLLGRRVTSRRVKIRCCRIRGASGFERRVRAAKGSSAKGSMPLGSPGTARSQQRLAKQLPKKLKSHPNPAGWRVQMGRRKAIPRWRFCGLMN